MTDVMRFIFSVTWHVKKCTHFKSTSSRNINKPTPEALLIFLSKLVGYFLRMCLAVALVYDDGEIQHDLFTTFTWWDTHDLVVDNSKN